MPGLALIVFGVVLLLLEIKVVSHGMLAIGGIVALLTGSLMLIRPGSGLEVMRISRAPDYFYCCAHFRFFPFCDRYGNQSAAQKAGDRH